MESQMEVELEERRKLTEECLKMESELKKLKREWRVKKMNLRMGQHNRLLEEKVAMLRGRQLRDGRWQVMAVKECRVEMGNGIEDGEGREMERNGQERSENQTDSVNKKFQCPHPGCGRKYTTKRILRRHMNSHTNNYQCQVCQKCLQNSNELRSHSFAHSNERKFVCNWIECGAKFKQKRNLKSHFIYKHLNERCFKCKENGCDKSFRAKHNLQKHLNYRHSSDRPFHCQVLGCDWRFKIKGDLTRHVKQVHSDVRKYRCGIDGCQKTFKRRYGLKRHQETHL